MAAPMTSTPVSQPALDTIAVAFRNFKGTVTLNDARAFESTTLQHVRQAALDVERQLAARQCFCNMRRLQPFLEGIGRYSKVMEVLCNGTPYLPWIWAPVKLILMLAADYTDAFEKIIAAYHQIAETLPRFDQLGEAFKENADFQQILATFYADILQFHQEAYKFTRRSGWTNFFHSSWGRFDRRFQGILEDLNRHAKLVDKTANAVAIVEVRQWREKAMKEIARVEEERAAAQYQSALSWLEVNNSGQVDVFDDLIRSCYPGTCEWALKNTRIQFWLRHQRDQPFLWVKGKPGSGKSVLTSRIIKFMQQDKQSIVLYYFCSYRSASSNQCGHILKSLIAELLRVNEELLGYFYDEFVLKRRIASLAALEQLIPSLISAISNQPSAVADLRIILDGLDECDEIQQKRIVDNLKRFTQSGNSGTVCKVWVSSRDTQHLNRLLGKKYSLSLNDEKKAISGAIQSFVHHKLISIQDDLTDLHIHDSDVQHIEKTIVEKSDGMFLWAWLVLEVIGSDVYDGYEELKAAVAALPRGLPEFYTRILSRLKERLGIATANFDRAKRTLEWITYAERPLKHFELRGALALHGSNTTLGVLPSDQVFDLCKPLVESRSDGTIGFVHFSAREYLTDPSSGPFIQPLEAYHDLALSCGAYLNASLTLIDPHVSNEERYLKVGKGLYGLHLYATEFWIKHLLDFASLNGGLFASHPHVLLEQFQQLSASYYDHRKSDPSTRNNETGSNGAGERLSCLASHGDIYSLVKAEFRSGHHARNDIEGAIAGIGSPSVEINSIFTKALAAYQATVRSLLATGNVPGLSNEELATFKRIYGPTAYTCRFAGCVRATVGFETAQLLLQHENSHSLQLRCTAPGCTYGLAFASPKALNTHVQAYHVQASHPRIPRSLRREQRPLSLRREQSTSPSRNAMPLRPTSPKIEEVPSIPDDVQEINYKLNSLNLDTGDVPDGYKKEGSDWIVALNPELSGHLDINAVHTLPHESVVCTVAFSKYGEYLATGTNHQTLLFSVNTGLLLRILNNREDNETGDVDNYTRGVCFGPDNVSLATSSEDSMLRVWDFTTGIVKNRFSGRSQDIYDVAFAPQNIRSPSDLFVAFVSGDRTMRVWDAQKGQQVLQCVAEDQLMAVEFSPDGRFVLASGIDNSLYMWDASDGMLIKKCSAHLDSSYDVAFRPNGTEFASVSLDKTIITWNCDGRNDPQKAFKGHTNFVLGVAYTSDSKWLISCSKDKEVRFWDPDTGYAYLRLLGHKNSVIRVAVSPDGKHFATAGGDMRARIWRSAHLFAPMLNYFNALLLNPTSSLSLDHLIEICNLDAVLSNCYIWSRDIALQINYPSPSPPDFGTGTVRLQHPVLATTKLCSFRQTLLRDLVTARMEYMENALLRFIENCGALRPIFMRLMTAS